VASQLCEHAGVQCVSYDTDTQPFPRGLSHASGSVRTLAVPSAKGRTQFSYGQIHNGEDGIRNILDLKDHAPDVMTMLRERGFTCHSKNGNEPQAKSERLDRVCPVEAGGQKRTVGRSCRTCPPKEIISPSARPVKIYAIGGRFEGRLRSERTDIVEMHDPKTNQWSKRQSMLRPRGGVNGIFANGCFHLFGARAIRNI
jgi:hypothetical protein